MFKSVWIWFHCECLYYIHKLAMGFFSECSFSLLAQRRWNRKNTFIARSSHFRVGGNPVIPRTSGSPPTRGWLRNGLFTNASKKTNQKKRHPYHADRGCSLFHTDSHNSLPKYEPAPNPCASRNRRELKNSLAFRPFQLLNRLFLW